MDIDLTERLEAMTVCGKAFGFALGGAMAMGTDLSKQPAQRALLAESLTTLAGGKSFTPSVAAVMLAVAEGIGAFNGAHGLASGEPFI